MENHLCMMKRKKDQGVIGADNSQPTQNITASGTSRTTAVRLSLNKDVRLMIDGFTKLSGSIKDPGERENAKAFISKINNIFMPIQQVVTGPAEKASIDQMSKLRMSGRVALNILSVWNNIDELITLNNTYSIKDWPNKVEDPVNPEAFNLLHDSLQDISLVKPKIFIPSAATTPKAQFSAKVVKDSDWRKSGQAGGFWEKTSKFKNLLRQGDSRQGPPPLHPSGKISSHSQQGYSTGVGKEEPHIGGFGDFDESSKVSGSGFASDDDDDDVVNFDDL